LLARKAARKETARPLARERLEERIRRSAEGKLLDLDFGERISVGGSVVQREPHESRLGFGQEEGVRTSVAGGHAAHGSPLRAIVGELHVIARRKGARRPMHDETTEFAGHAEVDRQTLFWTG